MWLHSLHTYRYVWRSGVYLSIYLRVFVRFDYEGLEPRAAFYLMRDLEGVISDKAFTSQKFAVGDHMYNVEKADNFEYIDPVDGTVARNQVSLSHEGNVWKYTLILERGKMFVLPP